MCVLGDDKIVKWLLEIGPDPDLKTKSYNKTDLLRVSAMQCIWSL